jgi:hypothetical protein
VEWRGSIGLGGLAFLLQLPLPNIAKRHLVTRSKHNLFFPKLLLIGWLLSCAVLGHAENMSPIADRPTNEHWSDGPTLYWKHKVATGSDPRAIYRHSRLRLKALKWGTNMTIPTFSDMKNYLEGFGGTSGALAQLKQRMTSSTATRGTVQRRLVQHQRAALASKDRVAALLGERGITGEQCNRLAEMMVWRGLAYNSSTLAHGSFGPEDTANYALQRKARDGLDAAIGESFKLGRRLKAAVAGDGRFLRWDDIRNLQGIAIKDFPDKEPGQVRSLNFAWPMNSFGVHYPRLHGDDGEVHKLWARLEKNKAKVFAKNPLSFMGRTLYWLHNVHPFRDGNGRTQVLLNWSMAQAAGFPLPLEYDQASGRFKLAATKWGGARSDLTRFIAMGAIGTERFVKKLLPVLGKGAQIESSHTNRGAVSMVTRSSDGQRHLLVMVPVTHAKAMDPELAAEQKKNRVVLTGATFDPQKLRLKVAVGGKQNPWQDVAPAAVHTWDTRYPWWTTVEPIFKVALPKDAAFVDFHVAGPDNRRAGPENFYMNLRDQ